MRTYDITLTISPELVVWPDDPPVEIHRTSKIEEGAESNVTRINMSVHTGTHIDAPYHFLKDGQKIDEIPVHRFIGRGILVDVSDKSDRDLIDAVDFEPFVPEIQKGDFVILKTGWDRYFGMQQYLQHPFLSADAGRLLLALGVSLVGIDALNVDASYPPVSDSESLDTDGGVTTDDHYPVHDILLGNDILIVENLCNLDKINQIVGFYSFLPLKLKGSDGYPIRAIFSSG